MIEKDNYFKLNQTSIEERINKDNCMEILKFGPSMKVDTVEKVFFKDSKDRMISFEGGSLASDRSIIMCRNAWGFYVGILKEQDYEAYEY